MTEAIITRPRHIAERIVFLDGLTGTGKTMMGPILGSFARMEIGKFNHLYEYLCALDFLHRVEPDAAESLVKMYTDLDLYNLLISREVNMRPKDLSGIFQNPHPLRYLKRIFMKDGVAVEARIKLEKPILHLISHQALPITDLLFRALGDRLVIIEMVRHPLYLLEHWHSYIDRHGNDPRDFTIWIEYQGKSLPWFAKGWEEKYLSSNSMDKVIYALDWLVKKVNETISTLDSNQKCQVLFVPFEKFVLNPNPFLEKIGKLIDTTTTTTTRRVLKEQKCPRQQVAAGPAKAIYKRYAWKKPDPSSSDQSEMIKKRALAQNLATPEALKVLDGLCQEYETKYGLWF